MPPLKLIAEVYEEVHAMGFVRPAERCAHGADIKKPKPSLTNKAPPADSAQNINDLQAAKILCRSLLLFFDYFFLYQGKPSEIINVLLDNRKNHFNPFIRILFTKYLFKFAYNLILFYLCTKL